MLIFRQLFDLQSYTYTYLLGDSASLQAVLIDPVFEQARRDAALLNELGLRLCYTLETHVHADHVTGAWLLKRQFDSQIALAQASGAVGADRYLAHGDTIEFGQRSLQVRATPGHTNGCLTYVLDNESMAFTGDCLLVRGSGRTDFQHGDPHTLYRSVHSQILTLPQDCLLYPAHDYRGLSVTSVAEEQRAKQRAQRVGDNVADGGIAAGNNELGQLDRAREQCCQQCHLPCGSTASRERRAERQKQRNVEEQVGGATATAGKTESPVV